MRIFQSFRDQTKNYIYKMVKAREVKVVHRIFYDEGPTHSCYVAVSLASMFRAHALTMEYVGNRRVTAVLLFGVRIVLY